MISFPIKISPKQQEFGPLGQAQLAFEEDFMERGAKDIKTSPSWVLGYETLEDGSMKPIQSQDAKAAKEAERRRKLEEAEAKKRMLEEKKLAEKAEYLEQKRINSVTVYVYDDDTGGMMPVIADFGKEFNLEYV